MHLIIIIKCIHCFLCSVIRRTVLQGNDIPANTYLRKLCTAYQSSGRDKGMGNRKTKKGILALVAEISDLACYVSRFITLFTCILTYEE